MELFRVGIKELIGINILQSIGSSKNGSAGTPSTLAKESFKQALSQFLINFLSSKHLDQGIDIFTKLLSRPLDTLTLLNLNIKKTYPELYNLLKELHKDEKFSRLRLDIHYVSRNLHRLLHQKISNKNPKKLSNELASFLTNLILINKPTSEPESNILNHVIQNINKLCTDMNLDSTLLGIKLILTKPHFLNDIIDSWKKFCEELKIDLDPQIRILSKSLNYLSKVIIKT
jgi:hypothetical protein